MENSFTVTATSTMIITLGFSNVRCLLFRNNYMHKLSRKFLKLVFFCCCIYLNCLHDYFVFQLFISFTLTKKQVYYYIVDSPRNEGKEFFEINLQSGEIFTKVVFDREKQGAYALEVEARDGAPSARPNSNGQPNSGKSHKKIPCSQ